MSGGRWNDVDQNITFTVNPYELPKILEALKKCFNEIDSALSGGTSIRDAEHEVFNILEKLGDDLFPH